MERRLRAPRAATYALIVLSLLLCAPQHGWWLLALPLASLLVYRLASTLGIRAGKPEYGIAFSAVLAHLLFGISIAATGGPTSPLLVWLIVPFASIPARFTKRGVISFVVLTITILLAATVGFDPSGFASDPAWTIAALSGLVAVAAFGSVVMSSEVEHRSEAVLDPLTGLLNRKVLMPRFDELRLQARLTGGAICLIACDIDHFKAINDAHGHPRGDAVLKDVAYEMRKALRAFELVYRIGGEEFLVVLPDATATHGEEVAERLRATVEAARPTGLSVTASFGVAYAGGHEVEYADLYQAADQALYEAKLAGRNRVVSECGEQAARRRQGARNRTLAAV